MLARKLTDKWGVWTVGVSPVKSHIFRLVWLTDWFGKLTVKQCVYCLLAFLHRDLPDTMVPLVVMELLAPR